MPTSNIPSERLDNLAVEAVVTVFSSMVQESVDYCANSSLLGEESKDLLVDVVKEGGGFHTIAVGFVGDAEGKVMLSLSSKAAEGFALKLFDTPSLDWIGEDPQETIRDALCELGNMMAGLVKGGLTKWFPSLMLTTPKILRDRRFKVEPESVVFRKQYGFHGFGGLLVVDFSCNSMVQD